MKQYFILAHPTARRMALDSVSAAPVGFAVTIACPTRNLEQNAAMWPILEAFADQLEWPVNGRMEKLSAEEWKDLLTAAFTQEQQRVSPGLNGGMVLLGLRTSKMGKKEFSDFLEFLHATAVDRGVVVYQDQAA